MARSFHFLWACAVSRAQTQVPEILRIARNNAPLKGSNAALADQNSGFCNRADLWAKNLCCEFDIRRWVPFRHTGNQPHRAAFRVPCAIVGCVSRHACPHTHTLIPTLWAPSLCAVNLSVAANACGLWNFGHANVWAHRCSLGYGWSILILQLRASFSIAPLYSDLPQRIWLIENTNTTLYI